MDIQEIRAQVRTYISDSGFEPSLWDIGYAADIIDNTMDKTGAPVITEDMMTMALEATDKQIKSLGE